MSDLKRIDPEAIPGLYRKWDRLRPAQRCFYGWEGSLRCCINTILAVEAVGFQKAVRTANGLEFWWDARCLAALSGLDPDYAIGLAMGWDGTSRGDLADGAVSLGYEDGRTAWEACKPLLEQAS